MTSFDQDKYDKAREAAHNYFQKNKKVQSPALGTVYLNSDGFMHLIYHDRSFKKKRSSENQVKRFHLLQYARSIIEKMGYYQEYLEQHQTVMMKMKKHRVLESKLVKYWGFVAVVNDRKKLFSDKLAMVIFISGQSFHIGRCVTTKA